MVMPILFARIKWMKWYAGEQPDEDTWSGSLQEIENFRVVEGRVFGFAKPVTNGKYHSTIKLERIVPGCKVDVLTEVTVVFVATARGGGQRVVGWYSRAVVHRTAQYSPLRSHEYYFETEKRNAILIPEKARTCRIPAGLGAFGKSNLWYLFEKNGEVKTAPWISAVLEYMSTHTKKSRIASHLIERAGCNGLAYPAQRGSE